MMTCSTISVLSMCVNAVRQAVSRVGDTGPASRLGPPVPGAQGSYCQMLGKTGTWGTLMNRLSLGAGGEYPCSFNRCCLFIFTSHQSPETAINLLTRFKQTKGDSLSQPDPVALVPLSFWTAPPSLNPSSLTMHVWLCWSHHHQVTRCSGSPKSPQCLDTHDVPNRFLENAISSSLLLLEKVFPGTPRAWNFIFLWMHPSLSPLLFPSAEPSRLQHELCAKLSHVLSTMKYYSVPLPALTRHLVFLGWCLNPLYWQQPSKFCLQMFYW